MNTPIVPKKVELILKELNSRGFESYIVGGCVRDSIMGIKPHDWDITTSATPDEVKKCFDKTFDTGIKHGTVTVVIDKEGFEVTTFRLDGEYTDNRHPKEVFFTPDLNEDLRRRDFTMNAIAYNERDGYIDPFMGVRDIKKRTIRGVGDAKTRFKEDALRMLRGIRFSAQLGFEIEDETYKAICDNAVLINNISRERVREELEKLLVSKDIGKLSLFLKSGLLYNVSVRINEMMEEFNESIIGMLKNSGQELVLRLAIFFMYMNSDDLENELRMLKFDNKTIKTVKTINEWRDIDVSLSGYGIRKVVSKVGFENFDLLIKIKKIQMDDTLNIEKEFNQIRTKKYCLSTKELKIDGIVLREIGVIPGKGMGEMFEYLLEKVLANPDLNKEDILKNIVIDKLKCSKKEHASLT